MAVESVKTHKWSSIWKECPWPTFSYFHRVWLEAGSENKILKLLRLCVEIWRWNLPSKKHATHSPVTLNADCTLRPWRYSKHVTTWQNNLFFFFLPKWQTENVWLIVWCIFKQTFCCCCPTFITSFKLSLITYEDASVFVSTEWRKTWLS